MALFTEFPFENPMETFFVSEKFNIDKYKKTKINDLNNLMMSFGLSHIVNPPSKTTNNSYVDQMFTYVDNIKPIYKIGKSLRILKCRKYKGNFDFVFTFLHVL